MRKLFGAAAAAVALFTLGSCDDDVLTCTVNDDTEEKMEFTFDSNGWVATAKNVTTGEVMSDEEIKAQNEGYQVFIDNGYVAEGIETVEDMIRAMGESDLMTCK